MKPFPRLLITGAGGKLGAMLRAGLGPIADRLRLTDLQGLPAAGGHVECVTCDLADPMAAHSVARDVQAIVHLAGLGPNNSTDSLIRANVNALHNIYEAARRNDVSRIVFASSNHVTGFYQMKDILDPTVLPRPDGLYGMTKVFGETCAQFYFDRFGIQSVSLRIGSCVAKPRNWRELSTWLSPRDFVHLIERALVADNVGHTCVYGVSDNVARVWDISGAERIGFQPQDNADLYRLELEALGKRPDPDSWGDVYQGGSETKRAPL